MSCTTCDDTGWVCVRHPERPWCGYSNRLDACDCGAAGAICDCIDEMGCAGVEDFFADVTPKAATMLCTVVSRRALH